MMTQETLLALYRTLVLIRKVELKIEALYPQDEMHTPVHLSLGQEAVSAGVCAHLTAKDMIFSNHRSHAHYLAKGGRLDAMIAELYGRETGCSRGRGGSMHLIDTRVGHPGSSAIVAGGVPHAVGAALAAAMRGTDRVAVTFFGDAACEEGVVYESMNWAALRRLPVIFVCENNRYSVCSHLSARQPNPELVMRARAFDIPAEAVDGMDVRAVHEAAGRAVDAARRGAGPTFLECHVQRWRAHAGAGDPLAEQYRRPEDLDERNRRDPVGEFRDALLAEGAVAEEELAAVEREIEGRIEEAFRLAREAPFPRPEDLGAYLFVGGGRT